MNAVKKWTRKYLTQKELEALMEAIVAHLSESEDDFDTEDDEEADLDLEVGDSVLTMPIEFEDGFLLQSESRSRKRRSGKKTK